MPSSSSSSNRSLAMAPPRWSVWVATAGVLALLGALVVLVWITGAAISTIRPIPAVEHYALREVPPGDPRALRFDGPLIEQGVNVPLPLVVHPGSTRLRKVRLEIDLTPYLKAQDIFHPDRDGDPSLPRGPTTAILISQAVHGVDVVLNGIWLDGYPRSTANDRFMWFRPLMVQLPSKVLREGGPNQLLIEYTTWEPYFSLSPIYIGDVSPVAFVTEVMDFVGGSLANASKAFCFLAGLFMLGVWAANRSDRTFGLIGGVALLWATVYTLSLWVHLPPQWRGWWLWSFYACAGGLNALTVLFILRVIDVPLSRPQVILLGVSSSLAALLSPWLSGVEELRLIRSWIWLMLPMQAWATWRLTLHVLRTRSVPSLLLLALLLVAGVLIAHDYNVMTHRVDLFSDADHSPGLHLLGTPMYLTHLVLPPLLIMMARVHLLKYGNSVQRVRDANRILADTLRRREMELALAYDRQSEAERREAAQDERERIYRELHDGIGSRLVTTIFSVRDGASSSAQLEHSLLDILQGVRALISSSHLREERDLQSILFDYCVNLDSLLSSGSFQLEYDIEGDHEFVMLDDGARDLLRVVEESVANTLKYAKASWLRVELRQTDTSLLLSIRDNGQAPASDQGPAEDSDAFGVSTGRGIDHMRSRIEQMGGHYRLELGATGASTQVVLPLVTAPHERAATSASGADQIAPPLNSDTAAS